MPVWTEDDGSTTNYLDKQVDLEAGTHYYIKDSNTNTLFTVSEETGVVSILSGITVTGDVNGASASEMAHLSGLSTNIVTALAGKADKANVLELDNTSAFTPSADYHPATKKYVLDNSGGAAGTDWTIDQTSTYTFNSANIPSGSSHYATSTQGSTADTAVQPGDTFYIGTTSIAHNRGTGALTLAGITLTAPDLGTPTVLVGTNISGTAANLTVGATTGVAAGATVNDTDANLKARANHTGTQLAATISDFNSAATTAVGNTNVSTTLSIGTASFDVVNITSDGGTDDVAIPTATTGNAGVMSKSIYDQWATNTFHVNSSHAPADSLSKSAGGTMGADINMADNAIGFTQFEPTYNSSDTEVHFDDYGNKAFATFVGGNIADLNLYFPDFSCNCVLLLKQDATGSRTVTYFKTFDQADGNESTVQFAGGLNPTLTATANKIDIISFYWDNDNHKAYGTITKNF